MIEEIKKEIRKLTFKKKDIKGNMCNEWTNCLSYNDDIKPILDKYNNQDITINQLKDNIRKGLISAKELDNIISELRQEYFKMRGIKENEDVKD